MATIQCNEINQVINELLIVFDDCKKIDPKDLRRMVELIAAIYNCANGGVNYNTLITENYQPITDEVVTYPINTYHSISVMILEGNITRTINSETITFPTGTVLDHEVTTLNQYEYSFTVKAGANVIVEYLIETV